MKETLFSCIDAQREKLNSLADRIFDLGEYGSEEYQSSAAICEVLKENGFAVTKNIADMPTAFRAVYQSLENGPRIGLLCEYDALFGIGHACGHHLQAPSAIGTAIALKACLGGKVPFTVVIYGCPDEEGNGSGGKQRMVERGCFRDIDIAMIMHGGTETTTDLRTLACAPFEVLFTAKPDAHDRNSASRARDAMLLAFEAVEFLREHITDDARVHYTYQVNDKAEIGYTARFSVRAMKISDLEELKTRFRNLIAGAARMAGAEATIQANAEYMPKIPTQELVDSFYENADLLNIPDIEPPRKRVGSSDTANVLFEVPGIGIRVPYAPKGTSAHSSEWLAAGKKPPAYEAILYAAKTMAGMAYDFISDPARLEAAREQHRTEREALLRSSAGA